MLSARVVRAVPNDEATNLMRAMVLRGQCGAWEAGPRSAAELKNAATHYERAAAACNAPVQKAHSVSLADWCRNQVAAM